MRVGSLFSGVGGLDLGLERAGMRVVWQVEIDPYCRAILRKRWPEVALHGDVRVLRADSLEPVDVLVGGFPCQPSSKAGKRKGTSDDRWLWPEVARLVRELRPRYLLVENVPGLLLPYEYPRKSGRWWPAPIEEVLGDLASSGYDAEWDSLPAAAVGAPHLRDRVFLVAYPNDSGRVDGQPRIFTAETWLEAQRELESGRPLAHADSTADGCRRHGATELCRQRPSSPDIQRSGRSGASLADPEILTERTGLRPSWPARLGRGRPGDECGSGYAWTTEPDVGRVAYGVPSRVDRLRCLGNAVVPQVAEWIGRRLMAYEAGVPHKGDDA